MTAALWQFVRVLFLTACAMSCGAAIVLGYAAWAAWFATMSAVWCVLIVVGSKR